MSKEKLPVYLLVVLVLVGGIVVVSWLVFPRFKTTSLPAKPKQSSSSLEKFVISPTAPPTLSPEKIEVIAKIETHRVEIENNQFNPSVLQIKPHDQVMWVNKNNQTHQISGEGWGNVPIGNGESFTYTFDEPGTYPYSCSLNPEMKGTISVSQ